MRNLPPVELPKPEPDPKPDVLLEPKPPNEDPVPKPDIAAVVYTLRHKLLKSQAIKVTGS